MLPAHLMHARLDFDSTVGSLRSELRYSTDQGGTPQPFFPQQQDRPIILTTPTILHGVDRRKDGVVITGPGSLTVSTASMHDADLRSELAALDVVQMYLSFGVAGVERRIQLSARLDHTRDAETPTVEWHLKAPAEDPWAEVDE